MTLARPTGTGPTRRSRAIRPRFATRAAPPRDSVTAAGDETRLDSAMPGAAVRAGSVRARTGAAVTNTRVAIGATRARAPESRASRTRRAARPRASSRRLEVPFVALSVARAARAPPRRAPRRARRARRAPRTRPGLGNPENAPCPSPRPAPLGRLARSNDPSCTIWANAGAASASAFSRSGGTPATSESVGGSFTFSANDANAFAPSSTRDRALSQKGTTRANPRRFPRRIRNARPGVVWKRTREYRSRAAKSIRCRLVKISSHIAERRIDGFVKRFVPPLSKLEASAAAILLRASAASAPRRARAFPSKSVGPARVRSRARRPPRATARVARRMRARSCCAARSALGDEA